MKRLILIASTAFLIHQAAAQDHPKSFFINAGISGSIRNHDDGTNLRSLSISPAINYMLNKQLAVGFFVDHKRATLDAELLEIHTAYGYYTTSRENTTKVRNWYIGPQMRLYYPVAGKLHIFMEAQGGVNFEIMKTDHTINSTLAPGEKPSPFPTRTEFIIEDKDSRHDALFFQVKVSPAVAFVLNSSVTLELKANLYNYTKVIRNYENSFREKEDETQSEMKLANASIGASFYF